ncbi:MAG: aromatic amino acid transport family protein [Candidatus Jorgensenbacteria bacterium]
MSKPFMLATGLLAGTVIGAGMFSLPYVFSRVGVMSGLFYLLAFSFVYFAVHLMYARVVETRPDGHQFSFFARAYLPMWASLPVSLGIFTELLLVLVAYLVLAPTFGVVAAGLSTQADGTDIRTITLIVFWLTGSLFMFARLTWQGIAEIFGAVVILGIVAAVLLFGTSAPLTTPAFTPLNFGLFFLPFGPLLFSLAGRPAVTEVVEEHRRAGKSFSLTKAIAWGTFIPAAIYAIFALSVLRLNPAVTPEALNSLGGIIPPYLLSLLGVLGLITLWTSYFIIGENVRDMLHLDWKMPKWFSSAVVVAVPLLLYLAGLRNFLGVISFTGGVFLAVEGVAVIAMWRRAFPGHRWGWVVWPLAAVFAAAFIYEFITVLW